MVGLRRMLKATALAIITTVAAIPNLSITNTAPALASTTPLIIPGLTSFSHGNMISFINTDSTPRRVIITSNDYDPLTTTYLDAYQTASQSVPDYWSGNAYAVNKSLSDITGILAEFSFLNESQVFFDFSSIVNPCDMDGVKIIKPAIADEPVSGCDSMKTPCTDSYLYSADNTKSISTPERMLLVYIGNGKQMMPVVSQLPFSPYTTVMGVIAYEPTSCSTMPSSPTSPSIFSPPTTTFTSTSFISSQSIIPTSLPASSLASVSTVVISVTQTIITTISITTSSSMSTSFALTSPPAIPPVTETINITSLISIPEFTTTVTVNFADSGHFATSINMNASSVYKSLRSTPSPSTVTFPPCTTTLTSSLTYAASVSAVASTSVDGNMSDDGPHIRVAPLKGLGMGQRNPHRWKY